VTSFGLRMAAGVWTGGAIVCRAVPASGAALGWTGGAAVATWAVVVSGLLFVLASETGIGVETDAILAGLESFCGESFGVSSLATTVDSTGACAVATDSVDVELATGWAPN
jgi:hypothetical protein